MIWVRLEYNRVIEIIQEAATDPDIAYWYGQVFASQCIQAPLYVQQGWYHDPETGEFSEDNPHPEPEPDPDPEHPDPQNPPTPSQDALTGFEIDFIRGLIEGLGGIPEE